MADPLSVPNFLAGLCTGLLIGGVILVPIIILLAHHKPKSKPKINFVIGPVSEQHLSEQIKKEQ